MQFGLDLALYSIIGGAVGILLLVLISFLINSKRITALEERIELLEKDHFDLSQEANGMTLERETLARKLAHSEAKLTALEGAFRAVRENNDALVDSIHKLEEKLKGDEVKDPKSVLQAQVYDKASGADFKMVSAHEMAVNTPGETPSIVKNTLNPSQDLDEKEALKEQALKAQKQFNHQREVQQRQEQLRAAKQRSLQMQDPAFFDSQAVVDKAMHLMDEGASYDKIMHDTLLSAEELDMLYAVRSKNDGRSQLLKSELEHLKPQLSQVSKSLYAAPDHEESFDPEFILEKQRQAQAAIERLSKSQEQVVPKVSYNNYQDDEDEELEIRKSLAQAMQQDFDGEPDNQQVPYEESSRALEDSQLSTQSFQNNLSHHVLPPQEDLYAKEYESSESIEPRVAFDSQGSSGHELVTQNSKLNAGEERDLRERLAKAMHEYEEEPLPKAQQGISENTKIVLGSQEPSVAQSRTNFTQQALKPQAQETKPQELEPSQKANEGFASAEDVALEIAKLKAQGVVFNQKPTTLAKTSTNTSLRDGPMVSKPQTVAVNHPKIASKVAQGAYGINNAPHSLRSRKR